MRTVHVIRDVSPIEMNRVVEVKGFCGHTTLLSGPNRYEMAFTPSGARIRATDSGGIVCHSCVVLFYSAGAEGNAC